MSPVGKRLYKAYNPVFGYPTGNNLFYECTKCGCIGSSMTTFICTCTNLTIDADWGRIAIKDNASVQLFLLVTTAHDTEAQP